MASIIRRGPKQYLVRIRRKGWPLQSKTFETKEEAEAWAREVETEIHKGTFVSRKEAENTTLEEALNRYLRENTPHKKGASQEKSRINLFLRSGLAPRYLSSIRGTDVAAYRDKRLGEGMSPHTINNELILLSNLFTVAAKEWGMEGLSNPVAKIRRPKQPQGRDRRLSADEEELLMAALPKSVVTVVSLALETAMRRGELAALRWEYIDLKRRLIHLPPEITKTNKMRTIPLSSIATSILKALPRNLSGKVFNIGGSYMSRKFKEACDKAGIEDLHFHDLRHEATSRFFEGGMSIERVRGITGHQTLQMLMRYTHLHPEDLAADLDRAMAFRQQRIEERK